MEKPLDYYRGADFGIGLDAALADAAASTGNVTLAVVLTRDSQILLYEDTSGLISVLAALTSVNRSLIHIFELTRL